VSVRANPNGTPTGKIAVDQHVLCLPVPEAPNYWNLQLQLFIHSSDQNSPFCYEIEIHSMGVVELTGDFPSEKREAIAAVNGLGLLYGACREMLINITGRSIYGAYSIPSLNFAQVLKEANEKLQAKQVSPESVKA